MMGLDDFEGKEKEKAGKEKKIKKKNKSLVKISLLRGNKKKKNQTHHSLEGKFN